MGTQKNRLNERLLLSSQNLFRLLGKKIVTILYSKCLLKHMFKLMDKKIIAILHLKVYLDWLCCVIDDNSPVYLVSLVYHFPGICFFILRLVTSLDLCLQNVQFAYQTLEIISYKSSSSRYVILHTKTLKCGKREDWDQPVHLNSQIHIYSYYYFLLNTKQFFPIKVLHLDM